jgi:hypothetical protein
MSRPLDSATPGRPPKVPFFGWERYVFMFLCEKNCACGHPLSAKTSAKNMIYCGGFGTIGGAIRGTIFFPLSPRNINTKEHQHPHHDVLPAAAIVHVVAVAVIALVALVALIALVALAALAQAVVALATLALVTLAIALALHHHPIIHVNCDHM